MELYIRLAGDKSTLYDSTTHLTPFRHLPPPLPHLTAAFSLPLSLLPLLPPTLTFSPVTSPHLDQLSLSYRSIYFSILPLPPPLSSLAFLGVNQACPQQPLPFHLQHTLTFPDTLEGREQRHHTPSLNCSISSSYPLTPILPSVFLFLPVNLYMPTRGLALKPSLMLSYLHLFLPLFH